MPVGWTDREDALFGCRESGRVRLVTTSFSPQAFGDARPAVLLGEPKDEGPGLRPGIRIRYPMKLEVPVGFDRHEISRLHEPLHLRRALEKGEVVIMGHPEL